jgi:hypothetical protein
MNIQIIMASTINIPIAFEFRPFVAPTWSSGKAHVLGLARERHNSSGPLTGYLGSGKDVDAEISLGWLSGLQVESYPAILRASGVPQRMLEVAASPKGRADIEAEPFEILTCPCTFPLEPGKAKDAWGMRDEFLSLKKETKALFAFLEKWGFWDMSSIMHRTVPQRFLAPPEQAPVAESPLFPPNVVPYYVIPERIWEWQAFFREALSSPPDKWLAYADGMQAVMQSKRETPSSTSEWENRPETLVRSATTRPGYPHFSINRNLCLGAIDATITIDFLRKVKFRPCKRQDCGKPFAIESHHKRKYCSQYCGHLESMRKQSRERAKQAKKQNARKKG